MTENKEPLLMGDWILFRDSGSLYHNRCKRFHNLNYDSHMCVEARNYPSVYDIEKLYVPHMVITITNTLRESLKSTFGNTCTLPLIQRWGK